MEISRQFFSSALMSSFGGRGVRPSADPPGGAATLSQPGSWRWMEGRVLLLEASSPKGSLAYQTVEKCCPFF